MRYTNLPSQITTIDDNILGKFNFIQTILIIFSLISIGLIFSIIGPSFELSGIKIALISLIAFTAAILSTKVKNKIIISWLFLIIKYYLRPKIYLFGITKNEHFQIKLLLKLYEDRKSNLKENQALSIAIKSKPVLECPEGDLEFKLSKKGALYVFARQNKQ